MAEGDLDDPVDYGSIVRNNLMKRPLYTPYCGHPRHMNRTSWDGAQFRCTCGYRTEFPEEFLALYLARWPDGPALTPTHKNGDTA